MCCRHARPGWTGRGARASKRCAAVCGGAGALLAAPDYAEAHNNLGVLQRDVGTVPDAIASYNRCLDLAPDSRNAGEAAFDVQTRGINN